MNLKFFRCCVAAAALSALGSAAAASAVFGVPQDTASITFWQSSSPSLIARMDWTLTSVSGRDVTFKVKVENTSVGSAANRLAGFGLTNITPNAVMVTDSSEQWDTYATEKVSLGGQEVELCSRFDSASSSHDFVNCDSGNAAGLAPGEKSEFNVTLRFASGFDLARDKIRFDNFIGKFSQTGTGESSTKVIAGNLSTPVEASKPNAVPEPGSLALIGVALLALVGVTKRRKR